MKKITLKKRSASVMAGLLALVLVGGTWAYYSSNGSLENKLSTKMPGGDQLVEQFTPEDDWSPGQKIDKVAGIENKGDVDLLVRVKMDEKWTLAGSLGVRMHNSADASFVTGNGQVSATDGLTLSDGSVVAKEMDITNWNYGGDGYWYYKTPLVAGTGATGDFLKSITLASDADMGQKGMAKYYTKATVKPEDDEIGTDADSEWVAMPLTGMPEGTTFSRSVSSVDQTLAGYAGASYSLTIYYETYQATTEARAAAVAAGWNGSATAPVS